MRLNSGRNESSPCAVGQRIAVLHEGLVERDPVGGGQHLLRQRQHLDLLDPHVVEVGSDVGMHPRLEVGQARLGMRRLAHHLQRQHVVLELEHGAMAGRVVAVEPVEHRRQLRAARAQQRKEQLGFLGVVHLLRELVDVEEHRAQDLEVRLDPVAPALGEQQADRAQHRRERAVLGANDLDGGMGSHRRLLSVRPRVGGRHGACALGTEPAGPRRASASNAVASTTAAAQASASRPARVSESRMVS